MFFTRCAAGAIGLAAAVSGAIVPGKAFDRFVVIWLENTDYDKASSDPNLSFLASKGIKLTQHYAVTHPSQPNYVAAVSGEYYGMNNDNKLSVPSNVSTIVDLLEAKGISWATYQEDMPSTAYPNDYKNPSNGRNMYVRKHNPFVIHDSVVNDQDRANQIKPLTAFKSDLNNNALAQWIFITPNMTSDGHDTSVTTAGTWTRNFVEPLLTNQNFMQNTVVLVTFDENETYKQQNKVVAILLGDAVPSNLVGTADATYYNHYSELSTVEANWGLDTLGRWDVGANVFKFVADQTGDSVRTWDGAAPLNQMYFNASYWGPLNSANKKGGYAVPKVDAVYAARSVDPTVQKNWKGASGTVPYGTKLAIPDGQHPPKGFGA